MRYLSIFLVMLLISGIAGAAWYPRSEDYNTTGDVNADNGHFTGDVTVDQILGVGTNVSDGKISEPLWVDDGLQVTGTSALNETTATNITATGTITGALTGTASRIPAGTFLDTSYGLKNSTANKAQVNLTSNDGLEFGTGAALGSLGVKTGDGLDTGATGVLIDVTDFLDTNYGLTESTNDVRVNISTSSGLEFGSGATQGALKIDPADASITLAAGGASVRSGMIKRTLATGTAAATNVTVSGMATGDELISVVAYTTAISIASMADRTSEYAVGSGILTKAAGTNETGNQLDIMWLDRTA